MREFIQFYLRISRSKDHIVRKNAAINLPCFFYYFGNYETEGDLDFVELYCEFADDESREIRAIIARGIHEILSIIEKSNKGVFIFAECF